MIMYVLYIDDIEKKKKMFNILLSRFCNIYCKKYISDSQIIDAPKYIYVILKLFMKYRELIDERYIYPSDKEIVFKIIISNIYLS